MKGRLNFCDAGTRFGSTKLPVAVRCALTLTVLCALLIVVAHPAQAQTGTVLYNFTGGHDGGTPSSNLLSDGAGNFYGTTEGGGLGGRQGGGTVFEISPNGSGGWNETVLYAFCSLPNCTDGSNPTYAPLMFDSAGNLYGTARGGGAHGYGVVFELSPTGGSWTETVLYSFANNPDGANPIQGLIADQEGNLYGLAVAGGSSGWGVVFELSPSGGGWSEQVIYTFEAQIDVNYAGLTMDTAGNIFGAAYHPGKVFELSPNGNGGWTWTVIYTFAGGPKDGDLPQGTPVFDRAGNLYGTTQFGGPKNIGTVYRLRPGPNGKWKEKILHYFKGGAEDGSEPSAGIVFDAAGNMYGTTVGGGASGAGTVFELAAPVDHGSYEKKLLWSLDRTDGNAPFGSLILDSAGNLYGTATAGGSRNAGVVFEVTP